MQRVEKSYVDKLVALKSLALSLSKSSPDIYIYQNRFLPDLSYTFHNKVIDIKNSRALSKFYHRQN